MQTIGIIGSGRIGGTLARLAAAAGYSVMVSNSRAAGTLTDLAAQLGPNARAVTPAEASEAGDLVVLSIPIRVFRDTPAAKLAGKTVIDTMNYDPALHGRIAELDAASVTTSELLQRHLSTSRVVKACNNIFFQTLGALARPAGATDRTTLPIAGDDADAKADAAAFLDAIGYDALDAGPLAEGWRWQPGTPAHGVYAGETIHAAVPGGTGKVRAALDAAIR